MVDAADKAGVRLLVLNNLPEIFRHPISTFRLHDKDFISLRDEPLENPVNRMIKRTVDLLMSLPVVLFIVPPLCLVVKIFQMINLPVRCSIDKHEPGLTTCPSGSLSFRTMRVDKGDDAAKQATAGDPRIYMMGRILRKTSLDEIPQFLNVFFRRYERGWPSAAYDHSQREIQRSDGSVSRPHICQAGNNRSGTDEQFPQ